MDTYRNHLLEDTRERIVRDVTTGFAAREQIVDRAIAYLRDDPDNEYPPVVLRRVAERMTDEVLNSHYRQQATWSYPTDCDRLDEAFEDMNQAGILARQNVAFYRVYGNAEIRLEIAPGMTGYAFYHEQDTRCAQETGTLYLSFGAIDETEEGSLALGRRIVQILRLAGLETDWHEDVEQRIGVIGLDWKRRRPD